MSVIDAPARAPLRLPPADLPPRKRRTWPGLIAGGSFMLMLLPVVLLAGAGNPPCSTAVGGSPESVNTPAGGPASAGKYAQPLRLQPGTWYRVGATTYGGPADPTSGTSASIPDPAQAYLPAHPDTFAELSVLDHNPANGGSFTFADANALGNLPYMTGLRVAAGGTQRVLYKRDIGYGQGPGQFISNGQPYRLDVWWMSAGALGVSKTPVDIELAPASGTGAALGQTPSATAPGSAGGMACSGTPGTGPLTLTPGQRATILSGGNASAPASAPTAVKLAIAAANQIDTKRYPVPDVHFGALNVLWPAYDCSGAVSYLLYRAGLHSVYPDVSGSLESWGQPGPGKWITVYANSAHTWISVAGLAFDTSSSGNPPSWTPPGSGPRWRPNPTGNYADGLAYIVRHPHGL